MNNHQEINSPPSGTREMVLLQEVGPRDGLQNEPRCLTPGQRVELIENLADAGLQRIQIGAFVNPKRVPQMAGTADVWRLLRPGRTTRYSVLVLNQRGLESALAEKIAQVEIYVSASETHSMRNTGTTVERALEEASHMVEVAARHNTGITVGVMCAFGCFYEGAVPVERVVEIVRRLAVPGNVEVGLADTAGIAEPHVIQRVVAAAADIVGMNRLTLHLHDTRGFAMANLKVALNMGVRRFDTSVGGLGGCPFIPGAAGNISTEATAAILASLGFTTGVDISEVTRIGGELDRLLGRTPPGTDSDPGKGDET